MSDEEKKAMKYFYNLRATIDESNMLFEEDIDVKCGKETIKQITTILNLIEKQQKEIEELKRKRDIYYYEWKHLEVNMINKIKAILKEYAHSEIGDSERIIEFYKKMQSLLEKE